MYFYVKIYSMRNICEACLVRIGIIFVSVFLSVHPSVKIYSGCTATIIRFACFIVGLRPIVCTEDLGLRGNLLCGRSFKKDPSKYLGELWRKTT